MAKTRTSDRYWVLLIGITVSALVGVVGIASIYNSRALRKLSLPERYVEASSQHRLADSIAHQSWVRMSVAGVELRGFSHQQSRIYLGPLWLPISNREWIGWLLLSLALCLMTCATVVYLYRGVALKSISG
jgi:hypothetical protein